MVGAGGKSVYFFVVGALLLRVPGAFFFFLLRVPGAFCFFFAAGARRVFCCRCAASSITHLLSAASEHTLQRDIQGPGRLYFDAGARAHSLTRCPPPGAPTATKHPQQKKHGSLVHGWGRIKNVHFYSLLGLSTHQNINMYPTMRKVGRFG